MFSLYHKSDQLFPRRQISIRSVVEQIFFELLDFRHHCWPNRWVDGCTASTGVRQHCSAAITGVHTQPQMFLL